MEENKDDDIIYDLDVMESGIGSAQAESKSDHCAEGAAADTVCGISDDPETAPESDTETVPESDTGLAPEGALQVAPDGSAVRMTALQNSDNPQNSESSDNADDPDSADNQLKRMMEEMGAETLLAIIRDNRNAAIRQIISEAETAQDRCLPSGNRVTAACRSIFDLAALA